MSTIGEVLDRGISLSGSPTTPGTRLDAQVLLCHVLGIERSILYAYPERALTPVQEQDFLALIARRARHEPVAYLTGHKAFYGRDFLVDQRVLIPRPETELLIEDALVFLKQFFNTGKFPIVADIGTGSGAIPVTLALEEPRLSALYACDTSNDALNVALMNCQRYQVDSRIRLLQGDLIDPLPEPVDILLANLPYVGIDEQPDLAPDVLQYEPHLALFSGPHGLDLICRFCKDVHQSGILRSGGVMLLEIGYRQRESLMQFLRTLWPEARLLVKQDYAGFDRLLHIQI